MNLDTALNVGMGIIQKRPDIALQAFKSAAGISHDFSQVLTHLLPGQHTGNANPPASTSGTSFSGMVQTVQQLCQFDADHNGLLSKEEIQHTLGQIKPGSNPELEALGQNLLSHYDQLSSLDGQGSSVSYADVTRLAGRDGHWSSLSQQDWQTLGNPV